MENTGGEVSTRCPTFSRVTPNISWNRFTKSADQHWKLAGTWWPENLHRDRTTQQRNSWPFGHNSRETKWDPYNLRDRMQTAANEARKDARFRRFERRTSARCHSWVLIEATSAVTVQTPGDRLTGTIAHSRVSPRGFRHVIRTGH